MHILVGGDLTSQRCSFEQEQRQFFFEPGSSGRKAPAAMASSVHAPGFPGNFWCRKSAVRISAFSADLVMYLGNPLGVLSVAYHAETECCSPQFYGSCSITAHVNGGNSAWHRH